MTLNMHTCKLLIYWDDDSWNDILLRSRLLWYCEPASRIEIYSICSYPVSCRRFTDNLAPVGLVNHMPVAEPPFLFFPLQVLHFSLSCVDPMHSFVADQSHCVFISIDACLHVPKKLVRAAKLGPWQILQLISVIRGSAARRDCQQKARVCILIFIRFPVFPLCAPKD